tara:strand:+ start:386 stop:589 length:204 start_codon:yes stop_codon:yes gene_type:complete
MKMEIPTKNVVENLGRLTNNHQHHPLATKAIALDALDTIKAQALEIRELQAGICRLREEMQKMEKIA